MKAKLTDAAGVCGAIFAALCCAGTPLIVTGITALGLGFLRRDSILWPLMLLSLVVAQFGFWQGWRAHRQPWPFLLGGASGASLAAGVIVVHGPPAMEMIYGGAIGLLAATGWNLWARRSCPVEVVTPS
ncbi:MAG TPA: MerC domain-containing protein [Solirubrobacterales bacterium]|nr:MerC domain-containing protein [Solirubrobacterales bacterium]